MDHTGELADTIRRLSQTSVLVVGDVMLDRYTYGQVRQISREALVPILTIDREVALPGGAGNVVRNLTSLGSAVAFISVVGDDQAGSDLTGLVGGQPNVEPWLLVQGGRTTTQKSRLITNGQHLLRADREQTDPIHPKLIDRMLRIATDAMAATSVTILSDYGKGVLSGDVPTRLIDAAHRVGRPVIVGPDGDDFARYSGADVIMCGRCEIVTRNRDARVNEAAITSAAEEIRGAFNIGAVVVTGGIHGTTLVSDSGTIHMNHDGPGIFSASISTDTAIAVLASAIAAKLSLATAVRLSHLACGLARRLGNTVVRQADLMDLLPR